jgi:hypothetical protein
MINLPSVTAVIIDTKNHIGATRAIRQTLKHITPARMVFITDADFSIPNVEVVKIAPIQSKREYSEFVMKKLNQYFDTEHVLLFQHDGYVLDGEAWSDEFLKYDYVGAPWIYDERNVGNGGFSLRSKRLHTALADDPWIDVLHPEDQSICIVYRYYLEEKYGIEFAPADVAQKFAFESVAPPCPTFGFHNFDALPHAYKPIVVVTRTGAMGDVIATEPLLEHYHKKGYRVYLDTLPDFFWLFAQHHYPIDHVSNLPANLPYKHVVLDMAYEENPKQLHLKSYFEKAEITDYNLRNPKLNFNITPLNKLFKNYAVLHADRRPQGGRNVKLDWDSVADQLNKMGYTCIQVGEGESEDIKGAVRMKAATMNLLQYIVAGADLFVGIDSGVSHIAVAQKVPSVIMFGSVNPEFIHPEIKKNMVCLHNHNRKVCDTPFCWHSVIGCEGVPCYINEDSPPCIDFTVMQVIDAIKQVVK